MSKKEFIEGLRRSLASIDDYTFVNDTISYYENYIDTQIRMGKTETEVMAQLGEPRLIAKSICATYVSQEDKEWDGYKEFAQNNDNKEHRAKDAVFRLNNKWIRMPSWLAKVVGIIVLFLVLWVVFTVLRWLAPFIFMGVVAYMAYKFFFGKY